MELNLRLPEGFLGEEDMLSPFGKMLLELCEERKVTRMRLAKAAGVRPAYMTMVVRDPEEAERRGKRSHAPQPEHLPIWADELGLEGEERERFIRLGNVAKMHADRRRRPQMERFTDEVNARINRAESLLERFGAICEDLATQMDEAGITPKKATRQELQALLKAINAADEDL